MSIKNNTTELQNILNKITNLSANTPESDPDIQDAFITGTLSTYENHRVTNIGDYAFYTCSNLTAVNIPACATIGSAAFMGCQNLSSVNFPVCNYINNSAFFFDIGLLSVSFPNCISIGEYAFGACRSLASISFPKCTHISTYAFAACQMVSASFPKCISLGSGAFNGCASLQSLYLTGSSFCNLDASNVFDGAAITSTAGSIFVKASLVSQYKAATNWTYFSNRIFAYEPVMISFSVEVAENVDMDCEAEEGMTWLEWVDSESSTSRFSVSNNKICYTDYDGVYYYVYYNDSEVSLYDVISNTYDYTLKPIESGANLISFTIDGTSYQAEEGMTWEQWCDSEYNTGGFMALYYGVIVSPSDYAIMYNNISVDLTDMIVANAAYQYSEAPEL